PITPETPLGAIPGRVLSFGRRTRRGAVSHRVPAGRGPPRGRGHRSGNVSLHLEEPVSLPVGPRRACLDDFNSSPSRGRPLAPSAVANRAGRRSAAGRGNPG